MLESSSCKHHRGLIHPVWELKQHEQNQESLKAIQESYPERNAQHFFPQNHNVHQLVIRYCMQNMQDIFFRETPLPALQWWFSYAYIVHHSPLFILFSGMMTTCSKLSTYFDGEKKNVTNQKHHPFQGLLRAKPLSPVSLVAKSPFEGALCRILSPQNEHSNKWQQTYLLKMELRSSQMIR